MLIMNKLSPKHQAEYLAIQYDALVQEAQKLREENQYYRRIYGNACVMRDHYKAQLEKLTATPIIK